MNIHVKKMAKDDINFNLNGHATLSQVKAIINICKTVWEREKQSNGICSGKLAGERT
jgi:hypothetical protein